MGEKELRRQLREEYGLSSILFFSTCLFAVATFLTTHDWFFLATGVLTALAFITRVWMWLKERRLDKER